jgi:hypothetical protein
MWEVVRPTSLTRSACIMISLATHDRRSHEPARAAGAARVARSVAAAALMALVRFLPASEGVVYHLVAAAVIWLMATGIYHAGRNIKGSI